MTDDELIVLCSLGGMELWAEFKRFNVELGGVTTWNAWIVFSHNDWTLPSEICLVLCDQPAQLYFSQSKMICLSSR